MEVMASLELKFPLGPELDLLTNTKEMEESISHCMAMELPIKDKYLKPTILQSCGIFQVHSYI